MNPVMYILSDPSLEMSAGKLAAQVGHAVGEVILEYGLVTPPDVPEQRGVKQETSILNRWRRGGHYTKIVLQCDDLQVAERYLNDRGFRTVQIIDEGRTEFGNTLTPTCIGVEIVDKDQPHVQDTFSAFKLYKPKPQPDIDVIQLAQDAGWRPPRFGSLRRK